MANGPVIILTALEHEARPIERALKKLNDGNRVVVRIVGPRAGELNRIEIGAGSHVILAGVAGGLDPTLRRNEIVLSGRPSGFEPAWPYREGIIHTADSIVSTAAKKAELLRSTGAVAVDMESAIVQATAARAGVPCTVVRVILDPADEALPPTLGNLVDAAGRTAPAMVARQLIRHPLSVPSLMRLGTTSREATAVLAVAVRDLVEWLTTHPAILPSSAGL